MRKQRHVLALVIGAALTAACLLAAGPMAASDQGSWPASKVSAPTPKVAGMPAALAKNLANFDDLDFHVYTGQQWRTFTRVMRKTSSCTTRMVTPPKEFPITSRS